MTEQYKFSDIVYNRTITRLHCGDTIKIAEREDQKSVPVIRKYVITRVYKYIAIGQCGKLKKAFTIGDLVMMGIEPDMISVG